MSTALCENRPMPISFGLDGVGERARSVAVAMAAPPGMEAWLAEQEATVKREAAEKRDGHLDIWASILSSKSAASAPPYVHPLMRRSASFLSQKSLEICTESLGSETGSDDMGDFLPWRADDGEEKHEAHEVEQEEDGAEPPPPPPPRRRKELVEVNYHCSIGRRSPARSFPPPLPSLSSRDGPCLSMRPHRHGGRLVVEAVSVPSQNYLHAERHHGRLLLSFVETSFREIYPEREEKPVKNLNQGTEEDEDELVLEDPMEEEEEEEEMEEGEEEEEEEEEEVEVVDRGIVVEVKVSSSPQPQSGGLKVQRSSVVINKFVSVPSTDELPWIEKREVAALPLRQSAPHNNNTTTTATAVVAAAAAASSSRGTDERYWRGGGAQSAQRSPSPEKLFFTSKRVMNRQDLLHQMRRCSEHRRPLFIWEPCCIATS